MSDTDMRKLEARNERLQEALRAAGREIDSLTYAIAHDLRAPLMHIDGFAQLLQSSPAAVLDQSSTSCRTPSSAPGREIRP
jgi:light-regulated signal transduction histidine kinase (bacteriophytochrome)